MTTFTESLIWLATRYDLARANRDQLHHLCAFHGFIDIRCADHTSINHSILYPFTDEDLAIGLPPHLWDSLASTLVTCLAAYPTLALFEAPPNPTPLPHILADLPSATAYPETSHPKGSSNV